MFGGFAISPPPPPPYRYPGQSDADYQSVLANYEKVRAEYKRQINFQIYLGLAHVIGILGLAVWFWTTFPVKVP